MIISFGWTTPALLAGAKSCTRRDWDPDYARRFEAGQIVDAWNTSPRNVKGNPRKIASIRLTQAPSLERAREAPESDWQAEGFEWMQQKGIKVNGHTPEALWRAWRLHNEELYVVRFELVSIEGNPLPPMKRCICGTPSSNQCQLCGREREAKWQCCRLGYSAGKWQAMTDQGETQEEIGQ